MEVRRSKVDGAGWGVYTSVPHKRGAVICVYGGKRGASDPIYTMQCGSVVRSPLDPNGRLRWADGALSEPMKALPPPGPDDDRVGVEYLPGDNCSNMARFINHGTDANLRIGKCFKLVARRPIAPGEELLFNYGRAYKFA